MPPKKLSLSELRAQREEEKSAAGDTPRGADVDMADANDESTAVDYDDEDLACDDAVGTTNDVPMANAASPEEGEVGEDQVGRPSSPNPLRGLDGGTGVVITNRTDDDEFVDGMRQQIINAPERYPWRLSVDLYRQWSGNVSASYPLALFDCSSLMDNQASTEASDRVRYFTDLFFRLRYAEGKRASSADALTQAWNAFVTNFNGDGGPTAWVERLRRAEERFHFRSSTGRAIAVHQQSRRLLIPCCVGTEFPCPMCTSSSLRMTREEMQTGPWAEHVTPELRVLCDTFDNGLEREREQQSRGRSTTRDSSRNQQQDRGRPRSSSLSAPTYRAREGSHASAHETGGNDDDQSFDRYDQPETPRSNVGGQSRPPRVEAAVETLRAEFRAEVNSVSARIDRVLEQMVDLNSRLADQATQAAARVDRVSEGQSESLRLRHLLDDLRGQLETLSQAHEKLLKDHKRVLGILQRNNLEPPSKRPRRDDDKDEGAQHKT